jgi:DNA-binding NarL/FixJ family response regulator
LNTTTSSVRVLIADDHAPTRQDVRRALDADERFEVCAEVADAAEAVRAAIDVHPDVCLLDIRMPGGGLAAAWEICARLPQTKIVMLTVSDEDNDLFAALRAGAVYRGEAAMPRPLVARVLEQFRGREPRWRPLVGGDVTHRRLTSREWEVLQLLAQGCSTAEIADKLVLSASAIRAHITSIVRKLEVTDRAAAISLFRKRGNR